MKPEADHGLNAALLVALGELRKADRLETELERMLEGRGFEPMTIAAALSRLKTWRFLDDRRTVDEKVSQMRRRRIGRARIALELGKRGAPADELENQLAQISDESEIELAVELLAKRPKSKPAQAGRFLAQRGFDDDTIEAAITRVFPEGEVPG